MFNLLPGSVSVYTSEDRGLALKAIVRDLRLQGYPSINITTPDDYAAELSPISANRDWVVNGEIPADRTTVFVMPMGSDMDHIHMLRTLSVKTGDIVILVSTDPKIQETRLSQAADNLIVIEDGLVTYVKARYQSIEPKTVSLKD